MAEAPAVPEANKVFVGNLNRETTEETLRSVFGAHGEITLVEFAPSKKYGWITFSDASSATASVALSGTMIDEFEVRVEPHKPAPATPDAKSVYVGNLAEDDTEDSLRGIFGGFGAIESLRIVEGRRPELRRCYILFATDDAAAAALSVNGREHGDKTLRVEPEAQKKRERRERRAARRAEDDGEDDGEEAGPGRRRRRRRRRAAEPNPCRVFVANLPRGLGKEEIEEAFSPCGPIKRILRRFGYAFVEFEEEAAVEAALALTGSTIAEREITVERETGRPRDGDDEDDEAGAGAGRRGGGRRRGGRGGEEGAGAGAGAGRGRRRRRRTAGSGDEEEEEVELVARDDTVWVGGLPDGATEEEFQAAFAGFGDITRASIGRNGRFGHVQFADAAAAEAAIAAAAAGGVAIGDATLAVEKERGRPAPNPLEVYIGNLPESITEEDIRRFVSSAGEAESVTLRGRGVAYVRFATAEMATLATSIQGTINDNPIRVELALPRRGRRRRGRRAAAEE